jgi:hypothetical protein
MTGFRRLQPKVHSKLQLAERQLFVMIRGAGSTYTGRFDPEAGGSSDPPELPVGESMIQGLCVLQLGAG